MSPKPTDDDFEALVHRQSRFVFRVAYAMLRNTHDAEDVVQETFLNLYRTGAWLEMKDERAFLARAAWRKAVDRIRAKSGTGRREPHAEIAPDLPSPEADPEQLLVRANSEAAIHRLIDTLPEKLRQPLALSSMQELNSREVATILGIPEGTVRTRLMRARQMLKAKMSAQMEGSYAR